MSAPASPTTPPLQPPLPLHLRRHVVDQEYGSYTPRDHAVWRHILRRLVAHLAGRAHETYLRGLAATGIGTERIPRIEEMSALLGRAGWSAVAVRGFLPPAVFTELQSRGVLAIAADVRAHEHVGYTPAPDIVHESAGHAPILVDPRYAEYLRRVGEVGFRAIPGASDAAVFEAVRSLSVVKEDPAATEGERREAEERLAAAAAAGGTPSEGARASRLYWWTAEYGLVGPLDRPRIYGAGLLSSLGESARCLGPEVERRPLSAACAEVAYDITRMQPQLFVAPDFEALFDVLEDFARTLSFRVGGDHALEVAERAGTLNHVVLEVGARARLEVTGRVVARIGGPAPTGPGLRTSLAVLGGPVQVSRGGVALGDPRELPAVLALDPSCGPPPGGEPAVGIGPSAVTGLPGGPGRFHVALPGGVELQGVATGGLEVAELRGRAGSRELDLPRRALLLRGRAVPSVAGGPADPGAWERAFGAGGLAGGEGEARARARKAASLPAEAAALYERVRALREAGGAGPAEVAVLRRAAAGHPGEWLLAEEIEELAGTGGAPARYAASLPEPGLFR